MLNTNQYQTRCPLRYFWPQASRRCHLDGDFFVDAPADLFPVEQREEAVQRWCREVVRLGYNAVIIGRMAPEGGLQTVTQAEFAEVLRWIRSYGLKVVLKLTLAEETVWVRCPLHTPYREALRSALQVLQRQFSEVDALLWESSAFHVGFDDGALCQELTRQELVTAEIRLLEELAAPFALCFFMPSAEAQEAAEAAKWLVRLVPHLGLQTQLLFSAFEGKPWMDHLALHPLWKLLSHVQAEGWVPLVPIFNAGAVYQGEGRWPALPTDLYELFPLMHASKLVGGVALAPQIPTTSSWLNGLLWICGHALDGQTPYALLIEQWVKAHGHVVDFADSLEGMKNVRQLVRKLSLVRFATEARNPIRPETLRPLTEAILKEFQFLAATSQVRSAYFKSGSAATFEEYLSSFESDAKRLIAAFLQANRYPLSA